ncbi:hypothetical protein [Nocardia farcinica]|nr:hypothetical protein [Nocardia farcinica]
MVTHLSSDDRTPYHRPRTALVPHIPATAEGARDGSIVTEPPRTV